MANADISNVVGESRHLPECPAPLCDAGAPNAECMGYEDCHHLCCCDALRACEHRVRLHAALSWEQGFEEGRTAGLDAAREAVNRLASDMANWSSAETAAATDATPDLTVDQWMWAQRGVHRALAAIDALRQPPPPTAHYDPAAKDHRP